jgi:hypothetical protein
MEGGQGGAVGSSYYGRGRVELGANLTQYCTANEEIRAGHFEEPKRLVPN